MSIERGWRGNWVIVFKDHYEANHWEWLFGNLLCMKRQSYGQYLNAYSY